MRLLPRLFQNNRQWAASMTAQDPEFFIKLSASQSPPFLWIGCADSRVPANEIVGLQPGELFVHRNIANIVHHTDLSCLSVLQYAVEVLRVQHVIVCGHYACGGIRAALQGLDGTEFGLIDNWLRTAQDLARRHAAELAELPDEPSRVDRLCELNVMEQAAVVSRTTVMQRAWRSGQQVAVHGWIYHLEDGLLQDLDVTRGPGEAGGA